MNKHLSNLFQKSFFLFLMAFLACGTLATSLHAGEQTTYEGELQIISETKLSVGGNEVKTTAETDYFNYLGVAISRADLKEGSNVKVWAVKDGGIWFATKVKELDNDGVEVTIDGTVSSVGNDSFVLGNYSVKTTNSTLYWFKNGDQTNRESLKADVKAEVRALKLGDIYTAIKVYIIKEDEGDENEISGFISQLSEISFKVGEKLITTTSNTIYKFSNGDEAKRSDLKNELKVEVLYTLDGDLRIALKVIIIVNNGGDEFESEGIVSNVGESEFNLNNYTFKINNTTKFQFSDGSEASRSDLKNGLKIKVYYKKDGDFKVATKVIIYKDQQIKSFELSGKLNFIGDGFVIVGDDSIYTNNSTKYYDKDKGYVERSSLKVGMEVGVNGVIENGKKYASKIQFNAGSNDEYKVVSGTVTALEGDAFTVEGLNIKITDNTLFYFNGKLSDKSKLAVGMKVEVKYIIDGDNKIAVKVYMVVKESDEKEINGIIGTVADNYFTVGDFKIFTDEATIYYLRNQGETDRSKLLTGHKVEVKYYKNDQGEIIAIKVFISSDIEFVKDGLCFDLSEEFFKLGDIKIMFTNTTKFFVEELGEVEKSFLQNGMKVVVYGYIENGNYIATKVKIKLEMGEAEGVIEDLSDISVTVGDVEFITNANTKYYLRESGWTDRSALKLGLKVEVIYRVVGEEKIAVKIIIEEEKEDDELSLYGIITAKTDDSFSINETTFRVSPETKFFDEFGNPISFDQIEIGRKAEVEAIKDGDGYLAIIVKLDDDEGGVVKRGDDNIIDDKQEFGIVVDGKTYRFVQSTRIIKLDGQPGTTDDLKKGLEVQVQANLEGDFRVASIILIMKGVSSVNYQDELAHAKANIYPNPFNQNIKLDINVAQAGVYSIELLDFAGNKIANIHSGNLNQGQFNFEYNGQLSQGIYFIKVQTGNTAQMIKAIKID